MKIPDNLVSVIRENRAIIFLGSGASLDTKDEHGNRSPNSSELANMLSDKFLGGKYHGYPLAEVSDYALSESNLFDVQSYIKSIFEPLQPTEAHLIMSTLRWWAIVTTNYDLVVEKAYSINKKSCQILKSFIENGDRVEEHLRDPNSVPYLKLHGCITRISNKECPLILSTDQCIKYKKGRSRIFNHFYSWAYEQPIIFVGHRLQDSDLRKIILELTEELGEGRPRYYIVTPRVEDVAQRFWETKKISTLEGTFEDFIRTVDKEISSPFRVLVKRKDHELPISENFKSKDIVLTENCKQFLEVDVEYVKTAKSKEIVKPKDFYKGHNPGWSAVEQNLDARRSLVDVILSNHFLISESHSETLEFILIKGHAGSGKSVIMRRVAWEAARDYNMLCLFLTSHGRVDVASIKEIIDSTNKRLFLFVENLADRVGEIAYLAKNIGDHGRHLSLIGTERINEWNIYCESICDLVTRDYEVRYLTEKEIAALLSLLEQHGSLGTMKNFSPEEREEALKVRAGRQILVALHEATLGKTFEEIIEDEFNNIKPSDAQLIYLTICTLNRLEVPVRAGIVSRIHGIPFHEFQKRLFMPLQEVVFTEYSPQIRDYLYTSRHPRIAEMVFQQVLRDAEQRYVHYLRCLKELNIDYVPDRKAFRKMIQGRNLMELFSNVDFVSEIYKQAELIADDDAYLYHQMAIYEMNRSGGNLDKSGDLLKKALSLNRDNRSISHSYAELNLHRAEIAKTELEKEALLNEAKGLALKLIKVKDQYFQPHGYHTLVKVAIEKIKMYLSKDGADIMIQDVIRDTEKLLCEGLQEFPGNSYLLEADAQMAYLLANSERAEASLNKAFTNNPKIAFLGIRLARILLEKGDIDGAEAILKNALEANPNSRELHFVYSKMLIDHNRGTNEERLYHLKRSFSPGDKNYIAQILYGRQLFINGDIPGCDDFFKKIRFVNVSPDLRNTLRFPIDGTFIGEISPPIHSTYCFATRDGIRDSFFVHNQHTDEEVWSKLLRGSKVNFKIAFTLAGKNAFDLHLL